MSWKELHFEKAAIPTNVLPHSIATPSLVAHTLAESAKANDLNVYEYFKYLFEQMPNNDYCNNPDVIDSLWPWSKELPDICHLSYNRKKQV